MALQNIQNESEFARFLRLLDRYAGFLTQAGKKVYRSSEEEAFRCFSELSPESKHLLFLRLEVEISIFEETIGAGESLLNTHQQLWRYFVKYGYTPCSELMDKISTADSIQVFDFEQRLIFASLNFFDYVSFTLERIFCTPWDRATRRDPAAQEQLFGVIMKIVTGEIKKTTDPHNPFHIVEELDTEMKLKTLLRVRWVSPLYTKNVLSGLVAVIEANKA